MQKQIHTVKCKHSLSILVWEFLTWRKIPRLSQEHSDLRCPSRRTTRRFRR